MYDFANLLFAGPCNARCHFCIGQEIDPTLSPNNLDEFPPRNLENFIATIRGHKIRQVVFTGANTDPQLYYHEARLLAYLRQQLHPKTQFSLHTNGLLAQRKIAIFNQYDRVTLSLPSFTPATYHQMMGISQMPDLPKILQQAAIPVKISCLVTSENAAEIASFLAHCRDLGIQRVVLRKPFSECRFDGPHFDGHKPWEQIIPIHRLPIILKDEYRHNLVYDYFGMQVTLWDFGLSTSKSINLFSSGLISSNYLIAKMQPTSEPYCFPHFQS